MDRSKPRRRCDDTLKTRAPEELVRAVAVAAEEMLTSQSEYVRRALVAQLRTDGFLGAREKRSA